MNGIVNRLVKAIRLQIPARGAGSTWTTAATSGRRLWDIKIPIWRARLAMAVMGAAAMIAPPFFDEWNLFFAQLNDHLEKNFKLIF